MFGKKKFMSVEEAQKELHRRFHDNTPSEYMITTTGAFKPDAEFLKEVAMHMTPRDEGWDDYPQDHKELMIKVVYH